MELVDRTLIELARDIDVFRPTIERFVRGTPDALLLVEFAGEDRGALLARLAQLGVLMADLGFPGAVVEAVEPSFQRAVWDVRKAGLNIMMSMKGDGKPVSFVEDCAVRLEDLAEYTRRLDAIFARHGTRGTWYAHALGRHSARAPDHRSEGCGRGAHHAGHRRGVLRDGARVQGLALRRARRRHRAQRVPRGDVRRPARLRVRGGQGRLRPGRLFNPGKIVKPERMDDRELLRYKPGYAPLPVETGLDWSEWGGLHRAVEMCNNNGTCRKSNPGVMCPSYRVTMDERHVTRGRANTSGSPSPDSSARRIHLGCDGRDDGALRRVQGLQARVPHRRRHGANEDRVPAPAPTAARIGRARSPRRVAARYAPVASRLAWMLNLRDRLPGLAAASERLLGLSAKRPLPRWRTDPFRADEVSTCAASPTRKREATESCPPLYASVGGDEPRRATRRECPTVEPDSPFTSGGGDRADGATGQGSETVESDHPLTAPGNRPEVVLFADTFTTWFEPENARAAVRVLEAAGFRVRPATPPSGERRPLCCGRTFLAAGLVEEADVNSRAPSPRSRRSSSAVCPSSVWSPRVCSPSVTRRSCSASSARQVKRSSFCSRNSSPVPLTSGTSTSTFHPLAGKRVLLHGHCHQKAFGIMPALESTLRLVPELEVETVASSCCGMAGAFGYEAAHYETSMAMGELDLLPAVRAADPDTLIIAGGTSCRHQIADGAGREAWHVARVLEQALERAPAPG